MKNIIYRIQNFWFVNINYLMSVIIFEIYFWPTNQQPYQELIIIHAMNLPLLFHLLKILHQLCNLSGFWNVPFRHRFSAISQVINHAIIPKQINQSNKF